MLQCSLSVECASFLHFTELALLEVKHCGEYNCPHMYSCRGLLSAFFLDCT